MEAKGLVRLAGGSKARHVNTEAVRAFLAFLTVTVRVEVTSR